MDPLSVTASIIAILKLSSEVIGYLTNVKDASRERVTCAVEVSNLHSLLLNLRLHLEEGNVNTPWYNAVRALEAKNGPLDQFKQALETLQTKMSDGGRLKKAGDSLVWKFISLQSHARALIAVCLVFIMPRIFVKALAFSLA